METGDLDEAEKDYKHLESMKIIDDDLAIYYNNLAVYHRRRKDPEQALLMIKEVEKRGLEIPVLNGTLALIYADKNDDVNFYKYLEIAFTKACPVWRYLDDPGFKKYRSDKKLKDLLIKYQPKQFYAKNN